MLHIYRCSNCGLVYLKKEREANQPCHMCKLGKLIAVKIDASSNVDERSMFGGEMEWTEVTTTVSFGDDV